MMKKMTNMVVVVFVLASAMPAVADVVNAEYVLHTGNLNPVGGTEAEAVAAPDDGKFIQMDVNSLIVLCFPGDYAAVQDGTAAVDLSIDTVDTLFRADANILVSMDAMSWIPLGVYSDTANIDIDLDSEGIDMVKYVMVCQDNHYIDPAYPTQGFDLDAVVAPNAIALASIEKSFDRSDANLGDHVTVLLDVNNPRDSNVLVIDELVGPGLSYISGTFEIDTNPVTPIIMGDMLATEVESGEHQITFDVQVVGVEASDTVAENCAYVRLDLLSPIEDSNCAVLTLNPYEGFTKEVNDFNDLDNAGYDGEPNYVPIGHDLHWWLKITVENIPGDQIIDMNDIVVTDRLGGELEVDDVNYVSQSEGPVSLFDRTKNGKKKGGKTEKHHISWDVGDVNDANSAELVLEISTDINTGTGKGKKSGHQEYTSTGEHCLNSGAVLKFIDPQTGFQLSAHTPEICIEAYDPGY